MLKEVPMIDNTPKPTYIMKKARKNAQEFVEKDYSKGVLIIDLQNSISPEILKNALPHATCVACDPRFGTCHSESHHSFIVTFEESKTHRPDGEILLLPTDLFVNNQINYGYAGDNFGDSLFRLVKRVYGEELFLLGNVKKDVTAQQIQNFIPVSNCIFENPESTQPLDTTERKSFIISCNDISNFFFYIRSLPNSLFVNGMKRYCPIEIDVHSTSEKLVKVIDHIPTGEKTRHKKGMNRFIICNLPISIDMKALLRYLPHAGEEGDENDFESLHELNTGNRHALVCSFVSLYDELDLQNLAEQDFDGMRVKYGYIKTTPSACVKALTRYQNNMCGNWLTINISQEECEKCQNSVEKERLIISKTPGIKPQLIVWENNQIAHVDYVTKEECMKAKEYIENATQK